MMHRGETPYSVDPFYIAAAPFTPPGSDRLGRDVLAGLVTATISVPVGVTPGAYADSVIAAAADAKARGLDVEAVEFSDWTTPNLALDSGDIDVNYFQHRPFLDNAIKERGYKFTDVGVGTLANIGLYSLRHKLDFSQKVRRGSPSA